VKTSNTFNVFPMTFEGEAAPCSETNPDAFFPEEVEDANGKIISSSYPHEADAKAVCARCPVRIQCLLTALEGGDIGIWGGTTENERRKIKREKLDPTQYRIRTRKGASRGQKSRFL
jgi:WhiB family redox-sensing transcriptional regulator